MPPINYRDSRANRDPDLLRLRDFLASCVGEGWLQELRAGRPVPWTDNLRLLPDGLEYTPGAMFRQARPVAVPYHTTGYQFGTDGQFHLFVQGRSVCKAAPDADNFFAGLQVLNRIYAHLRGETAAAS